MSRLRWWLCLVGAASAPAVLSQACIDTSTVDCTPGLVVVDGKCAPPKHDAGPGPDAGSDAPSEAASDANDDAAADGGDASTDASNEAGDAAEDASAAVGPAFGGVASVSPASATALLVTWPPATDPATSPEQMRYAIYLAQHSMGESYAAAPFAQVVGQTSTVLTGLAAGTTYYVVVRATDEAGAQDQNTHELSATAEADTEAPTFAGALTAIPYRSCQALLSWPAASDAKTAPPGMQYQIYLADGLVDAGSLVDGGAVIDASLALDAGAPLATTPYGVTSITVTVPATDTPDHVFAVVAVDAAGNRSATALVDETLGNVSFAQSIQPLVDNSCAPSCHTLNTTNKLTPIMNDGYAYLSLTGGPDASVAAKVCKPGPGFCSLDAGDCPAWLDGGAIDLVDPGSPLCSVFYQVLNQAKMPPGVGVQPVTQCDVGMVYEWIAAGANNN
jgi:hypothetical protein